MSGPNSPGQSVLEQAVSPTSLVDLILIMILSCSQTMKNGRCYFKVGKERWVSPCSHLGSPDGDSYIERMNGRHSKMLDWNIAGAQIMRTSCFLEACTLRFVKRTQLSKNQCFDSKMLPSTIELIWIQHIRTIDEIKRKVFWELNIFFVKTWFKKKMEPSKSDVLWHIYCCLIYKLNS